MTKESKKISAFKLFYDEIIYKPNSGISFYKVESSLDKIRKYTLEIRRTSKENVKYYMLKLERLQNHIKMQLDKIYEINKSLFEYFFLIYKTRVEKFNDKIEDMPFILACSFYDDYRLNENNIYELTSIYAIPRFSSLEKKEIRNEVKGMSRLEYFIKILETSEFSQLYKKFIDKAKFILNIKPTYKDSENEFLNRIELEIEKLNHLYKRLERKTKQTGDYDIICELMYIAFKKKFINWNENIKEIIIEYFENIYTKEHQQNEIKLHINLANDIPYEIYKEKVSELIQEKESYYKKYEEEGHIEISDEDNSYLNQFKKVLINNYFDKRYKSTLNKFSTAVKFVDRAIELYELSNDLGDQIFERIMFDSSHSPHLKRNNDVKSALITKIYDLYNPTYLLGIYEEARNNFENLLSLKNETFITKYENLLNTRKNENRYHGPIPSMEFIKARVMNRRKEFILEHCITDLKSRDLLENYDTRNYDLYVIADGIRSNDLITLYQNMKEKINNFDFNTLNFLDEEIIEENYEKKIILKSAQEFIVKCLSKNLNIDSKKESNIKEKYRDICYGYLNEQIIFLDSFDSEANTNELYEQFLKARNEFKENSKWTSFIKNNNLKTNASR